MLNAHDIQRAAGRWPVQPLSHERAEQLSAYLTLLLKWNARISLTAIRDAQEIMDRHFLESIWCGEQATLPGGTLLDYGSGAGFPGLPIAITRPDLNVTLAEAQGRKAAFLREVIRTTGVAAMVFGDRVESCAATFDFVTLRAVDEMLESVLQASRCLTARGSLLLLSSQSRAAAIRQVLPQLAWRQEPVPMSSERVLLIGTGVSRETCQP